MADLNIEKKAELENVPLMADDGYDIQSLTDEKLPQTPRRLSIGYLSLYLWLVLFELANVLLFVGGPAVVARIRRHHSSHELDEFHKLADFNTPWLFDNEIHAQKPWEEVYLEYGVVSLTEEWANRLGLPPSAPTTKTPGQMVYQLDVYHNLHCITTIQKLWMSNSTSSTDPHALHCLNYLRQGIMCNAPLGFAETDNYEDYSFIHAHTCRDYNAIEQWVHKNQWKEFIPWTLENLHSGDDRKHIEELLEANKDYAY